MGALYAAARHGVPGEGRLTADVIVLGEQPGDRDSVRRSSASSSPTRRSRPGSRPGSAKALRPSPRDHARGEVDIRTAQSGHRQHPDDGQADLALGDHPLER